MHAGLLLLASLLTTGAPAAARGVDVCSPDQPSACASPQGESWEDHGWDEEEDEDQALIQTAGAKMLTLTKPKSGAATLERRSAATSQAVPAASTGTAELEDDDALLQLPGKAKLLGRAAPATEEAAKPAAVGPAAVPQTEAPRVSASPLWGPCRLDAALKMLSLLLLSATGLYLRSSRLAQESKEKTPLLPEKLQAQAEEPEEPAKVAEQDSKVPDLRVEQLAQKAQELDDTPPPSPTRVGASYAVPVARIARSEHTNLTVDVPVSPSVWPLCATFARLPGEASWAKVDLTVDVIAAAGLPPLLTCGPPGAAARLESSEGTGGTGATADEGGWTPSGDDAEPGAVGLEGGPQAALEVRKGSGQLAAWIFKDEEEGRFTVKRPSHVGWQMRVRTVDQECCVSVSKRSQDIGIAKMLTGDTDKAWAGKDAMDKEVKMLQIDTQPDTSNPESVLLLMCMMAVVVFQP